MKKLISLIGAGAMLLSVATPAFGAFTINKAKVKNVTVVKAETGENNVGNVVAVEKAGVDGNITVSGANNVTTGNARARNLGIIAANTSVGCDGCGTDGVTVNKAKVRNTTVVKAETGENNVGNGVTVEKAGVGGNVTVSGSNTVTTGDANAKNTGVILVNTSVSFGDWD